MERIEFDVGTPQRAAELFGNLDENVNYLEKEFLVNIAGRGDTITIIGEEDRINAVKKTLEAMSKILDVNGSIDENTARYCANLVKTDSEDELTELGGSCVLVTARGKPIKPKTLGQSRYLDAISKNFVVFGVGPAGTGKTYLAVAMAVKALKEKAVSRIILTRPAVEAGEKLGFLPGDLQNKVDPYLRPLYDAFFDTIGPEAFQRHLEKGIVEIAPLAYMRGRTLDNAFVVLDEAQNTTPEQMKMFLTRLGSGSKMVINGDVTQIDLPDKKHSGLVDAVRILKGIDGIETVKFTEKDVVRFRLVADIVKAYTKDAQTRQKR